MAYPVKQALPGQQIEWRSPATGWDRITGTDCVGATFHDDRTLGRALRVPNMSGAPRLPR
jgi:hypothetical protein